MKPFSLLLILTLLVSCNKPLKGNELLDKAISYHDPNNNWSTFNGAFNVTMETQNQSNRITNIKINLPESYFLLKLLETQ